MSRKQLKIIKLIKPELLNHQQKPVCLFSWASRKQLKIRKLNLKLWNEMNNITTITCYCPGNHYTKKTLEAIINKLNIMRMIPYNPSDNNWKQVNLKLQAWNYKIANRTNQCLVSIASFILNTYLMLSQIILATVTHMYLIWMYKCDYGDCYTHVPDVNVQMWCMVKYWCTNVHHTHKKCKNAWNN